MHKTVHKIPFIDNYKRFEEFNAWLKHNNYNNAITIGRVDYERRTIAIISDSENHIYDLDNFMLDFVRLQDTYVIGNIDALELYDFTRLYSLTHPEAFQDKLEEYAKNLNLLGETSFMLWDFNVNITPYGLELAGYTGSRARTHLVIPFGITSIGNNAFNKCIWLLGIDLPTTIKKIGEFAFANSGLESVNVPDSVEIIEMGAFNLCTNLKEVKLSANLKFLGEASFAFSAIEEIVIPNTLETIEYSTFSECRKLKSIKLPENLKAIGVRAFYADIKLESIEIPDTVEAINAHAFGYCTRLNTVKSPKHLITLGSRAFMHTDIEEIELPNSLKMIGDRAFLYCKKLRKANIPITVEEVGREIFFGTLLKHE